MSARERRRRRRKVAAGAGLGIGAALGASATAQAADYTVTNLNDSGPGSLRQALLDANANPGADRVLFQSTLTGQLTVSSELPITDAVQVLGPGAKSLTISGNDSSRIFNIHTPAKGVPVTISGLTLAHGAAAGGAAVYSKYANLVIEDTVISRNTATANAFGGGISLSDSPLTLRASTMTGNSARGGAGIRSIANEADVLRIESSTVSGNQATYFAGGIYLNDPLGQGARLEIRGSTIAGNTVTTYASYGGGGGIFASGGVVSLVSTIVADNTAPTRPDIKAQSSTTPNASFSLIENPADTQFTGGPNIFGQDPKLGPLADNGGPTPTEALLPGSPALDKGSSAGLTTDQRGAPRPFDLKGIGSAAGGDGADIGAYERNLCGKVVVNRVGTQGNDVLTGTAGADGILGLGGNDTLTGLAGNDALCGGPGKDKLKGGTGNDALFGQAGKDKLYGQAGNDKLVGGKGNDLLVGGKGKDKLKGGKGKDREKQ